MALALPPPETSLYNCQNTARIEGRKFVQKTVIAVGTCLKAVASNVIKSNVGISAGTSSTCVAQFRKVYDSRGVGLNKGLQQKLKDKIDNKCDPAVNPDLTHALADILGAGGGTAEDIMTSNIDTWCKRYNSVATIASVADWEACIIGSHNCEAAAAILTHFPRALEWIDELQDPGNMDSVPEPATDPTRDDDAIAGAVLIEGLLDPDGDGIANPSCGGEGVACSTGCCYVENPPTGAPSPADANCFEWTAPTAAAGAFFGACVGPGFAGFQIKTAIPGPCGFSPIFGIPCFGPPNKVIIPTESSCP